MKLASFTPIWNAELFIKPHFDMLSRLDKNIVFYNPNVWQEYRDIHYPTTPDNSLEILKTCYPQVEVIETPLQGYNELVELAKEVLHDYDLIFRLDVDMLMTSENMLRLMDIVITNEPATYTLDWSKYTINYYGDLSHGIKDAMDKDEIIISSTHARKNLEPNNFVIHHFRGWKPLLNKNWKTILKDHFNLYCEWYTVPDEIKNMFDTKLLQDWLART